MENNQIIKNIILVVIGISLISGCRIESDEELERMHQSHLARQRTYHSFIGKKLKFVKSNGNDVEFFFEDGSMIRAQGYKGVKPEYYPK